jgi:SAM-dependent methyltransferase
MPYFDSEFSLPTGYRFLLNDIIRFLSRIDNYATSDHCVLLDIGCGNKPYKKLIRKYSYTGLDLYTDVSNPDIIGDILDIPVLENSIDAALTVWVLDDIPEPGKALEEIARILKPGGYYFAVENQSTNQHFKGYDYFRFAPQALEYLALKNKLELLEVKSYGGDFALSGFILITAFNTMFNRIFGKYNILKPFYSLLINLLFYPVDRLFRIKYFRKNFEKNSIGYCYLFRKALLNS